jgi:hypothetical protein
MIHIDIDIQDEQEAVWVIELLKRLQIEHKTTTKRILSEEDKALARERVMQGCPDMDVEKMLNWVKESRQDRKLPFRD